MSAIVSEDIVLKLKADFRKELESFAARQGLTIEEFFVWSANESLRQGLWIEQVQKPASRKNPDEFRRRWAAGVPDVEPAEDDHILP